VNHYEGGRELETMKNVDRSVSSEQLLKIVNGNHQVFSRSSNNNWKRLVGICDPYF